MIKPRKRIFIANAVENNLHWKTSQRGKSFLDVFFDI